MMNPCSNCNRISIGTKKNFIEKWTSCRKQTEQAKQIQAEIQDTQSQIDKLEETLANLKKKKETKHAEFQSYISPNDDVLFTLSIINFDSELSFREDEPSSDGSDDEITVEYWEYNGKTYLLDPDTGIVYDEDTQECVGNKNSKGKLVKNQ